MDWNWSKDPDFGTDGTIKWNVRVKNNTGLYLRNVRVDFTSFDAGRKLISTRFMYVGPIPLGGTASDESYADLYGNEADAEVQVRSVHPER